MEEENNLRVTLMNDRNQGGTSQGEGELELMITRNFPGKDHKGIP